MTAFRSIRGGAGLGDAIYVAGVVRHLLARGDALEICTKFPDIYRQMQGRYRLAPYRRAPVDIVAHYTGRRDKVGTSQFADCCITAGLPPNVEFRLDWKPQNLDLIARLRGAGKPIIVVQMPRAPFARTDGFGAEFLPDCRTIQRAIERLKGRAFLVQIGAGAALHKFDGLDLDLANATSVTDVIDVAFAADAFLGQCSFMVPLAESLSKPALFVWSRRGLKSHHEVVRQMTPKKVLHRPASRAVIDDCSEAELVNEIDALCEQIRSPVAA